MTDAATSTPPRSDPPGTAPPGRAAGSPPPSLAARARQWARRIKRDAYALSLAVRDPRTPWYAKLVAACVVAYAFSPIDLIPDFIPLLGYLDDILIVPLGILLALKLIPADVMAECRAKAEAHRPHSRPRNYLGAAAIVAIWLLAAALSVQWLIRLTG
jgi:uncharacterized membrane protein YkvA (DUF1232 family)